MLEPLFVCDAMNQPARGKHARKGSRIAVTAQWRIGPRTAAWDALWRRVIAEVLTIPGASDAVPGAQQEDLHGGL